MDAAQSYSNAVRLFAVIGEEVEGEIEKKIRVASLARTPGGGMVSRRASFVRRRLVRKAGA